MICLCYPSIFEGLDHLKYGHTNGVRVSSALRLGLSLTDAAANSDQSDTEGQNNKDSAVNQQNNEWAILLDQILKSLFVEV